MYSESKPATKEDISKVMDSLDKMVSNVKIALDDFKRSILKWMFIIWLTNMVTFIVLILGIYHKLK